MSFADDRDILEGSYVKRHSALPLSHWRTSSRVHLSSRYFTRISSRRLFHDSPAVNTSLSISVGHSGCDVDAIVAISYAKRGMCEMAAVEVCELYVGIVLTLLTT